MTLLASPDRLMGLCKDHWQIICLVVISFCMHLYVFSFANQMIYDEGFFWVPEAKRILLRESLGLPTYPALSKLLIASGIWVLGDNPWGWRIPAALFGAASIILVYLIARRLAGRRTAVLASLFFATENLVFTFSGLAWLDTFAVAFMLLSFLLYLQRRYALSGLSLALAVACSPKALLAVFAILGHWFVVRRKNGWRNIAVFAGTSLLAFVLILPLTDVMATGQWFNPFNRVVEMWTSQTSVKVSDWTPEELFFTHPTTPWQWILDPSGFVLEPEELGHRMVITPTIWVLIVPSMAYLFYRLVFVKEKKNTSRFILLWFSTSWLLWIPLELYSDRPMYLYYVLPAMGATCIAVGYVIDRLWRMSTTAKLAIVRLSVRAILVFYIAIHVLLFLILSPLLAPFRSS